MPVDDRLWRAMMARCWAGDLKGLCALCQAEYTRRVEKRRWTTNCLTRSGYLKRATE